MKKIKIFGIGAAVLMLLLAISPAITAKELTTFGNNHINEKEQEVKLVTIRLINEYPKSNSILYLSKENASLLELFLKDLEKKFTSAQTKKDVILLLTTAMEELKTYGISTNDLNEFIINQVSENSLPQLNDMKLKRRPPCYNRCCFLMANASYYDDLNVPLALAYLILRAGFLSNNVQLVNLSMKILLYSHYKPLRLTNRIIFSTDFHIISVGLLGKKTDIIHAYPFDFYRIQGFTGLCIRLSTGTTYFLGYARSIIGPTDWFWGK